MIPAQEGPARPYGRLTLCVLVLALTAAASTFRAAGAEPSAEEKEKGAAREAGARDTRPIIRLEVKNEYKPEDKILPQVMEGRLVADLADMETFRTVGTDAEASHVLTCVIRDLTFSSGEYYRTSRDADSGGEPSVHNQVTVSLDLDIHLCDKAGKEIFTTRIKSEASRDVEISLESTMERMRQELIDRAAQRIEKVLRKRMKKL
jgi:hypothetical protein